MAKAKKPETVIREQEQRIRALESQVNERGHRIDSLQSEIGELKSRATGEQERRKREEDKLQESYRVNTRLANEIATLQRAIHILTKPQ